MVKNYIRTVRLEVQYDGSNYIGWQRQSKGDSIQSKMEEALSKIANEKVTIFCAGRTDTGVHARKQIVSVSLVKSTAPLKAFVEGTNALLPKDIRVKSAHEEPVDFLAITAAKSKVYRYYFRYAPIENVFLKTVWQTRFKFNISNMKKAAQYLVGTHDFECFQTHGKETQSSIRTIFRVTIRKSGRNHFGIEADDIYYLEMEGDGFLRHMVRAVMGTIMAVGFGKVDASNMKKIIASKNRANAGVTAPPHALFLWHVKLK